jgi:hypothetical protein
MDNTSARAGRYRSLTDGCGDELGRDLPTARNASARVTRALEAVQDGECDFAHRILDDLATDLWRLVEALEEQAWR